MFVLRFKQHWLLYCACRQSEPWKK